MSGVRPTLVQRDRGGLSGQQPCPVVENGGHVWMVNDLSRTSCVLMCSGSASNNSPCGQQVVVGARRWSTRNNISPTNLLRVFLKPLTALTWLSNIDARLLSTAATSGCSGPSSFILRARESSSSSAASSYLPWNVTKKGENNVVKCSTTTPVVERLGRIGVTRTKGLLSFSV